MVVKKEREYSEYDKKYQARPEQVAKRVARNKARREAIKIHWKAALKGKDIDHKKALAKWWTNSKSNLRIIDKSKNRAMWAGVRKKTGNRFTPKKDQVIAKPKIKVNIFYR